MNEFIFLLQGACIVKSSWHNLHISNSLHYPFFYHNIITKDLLQTEKLFSQKVKSTISILTTASGEITDPSAIANEFNNYFVNIGTEIASSHQMNCNSTISTKYLSNTLPSSIFLEPPSVSEIFNLIHTLNLKKSAGDNEISTYILRISAETISPLLCHLFTYVMNLVFFRRVSRLQKYLQFLKQETKQKK